MKRSIFALALAAALPFSAQAASELKYNFVELDYGRATADNTNLNFDGFGLKGSVKVAEPVYLFGAYQQGSDDFLGVSIDSKRYQAGVGYRYAISDKADFIGELSYLKLKVGASGIASADAHGGRISGGVRGLLADNFEGYVKANYDDGGDFSGDFSGTLGAQIKFSETWGLTGEAEFGNNANLYTVGVRASF